MALLTRNGFTGFSHYGHPCFIRRDYEDAHVGQSELERLEEVLGIHFSSMDVAMNYCLTHAPYLLYRLESDEIDRDLLKGRDPWIRFHNGYVHIVTGEYVEDTIRPTYDSYPCYKIEEPLGAYYDPHNGVALSGYICLGALLFSFLATLLGGKR